MPVPIAMALVFGAGAAVGALTRQPEINRLRRQVKLLQEHITELQALLADQQRAIDELKLRFEALRAYNFVEKRKVRGITRGYLVFQYAFREYVELMIRQSKGTNLTPEDARFFAAFATVIASDPVPDAEKIFIRDYVLRLHSRSIDDLKPISANDQDLLLSQVMAA